MDELSRLRERVAELEGAIRMRDQRIDLVAERLPKLLCSLCVFSVGDFFRALRVANLAPHPALPPSEKERG